MTKRTARYWHDLGHAAFAERDRIVVAEHAAGKSFRAIAAELGLAHSAVQKIVNKSTKQGA